MDIRRCFEILDLKPGVSIHEVKEAYRDLARVWHPDRFMNNPRLAKKAEEKLKELNEAYRNITLFMASEKTVSTTEEDAPPSEKKDIHNADINKRPVSTPKTRNEHLKAARQFYSSHGKNVLYLNAWRRFFARILDYMIFSVFLTSLGCYDMFSGTFMFLLLFPVLMSFIWVFIEAAFLSLFGTTPGKWLLRISLHYYPYSKKSLFREYVKRNLSVWYNGMGLGIIIVAPSMLMSSFRSLLTEEKTEWDKKGGFSVTYKTPGKIRPCMAVMVFIFSGISLGYFLDKSISEKDILNNEKKIAIEDTTIDVSPETMIMEIKKETITNPENPEVYYRLGKAYANTGHLPEAAEGFKQALKYNPDFIDAQLELGSIYIDLGRYNDANIHFRNLIRKKPDLAEAHYKLGITYAKLNRATEAEDALKKAITLQPDFTEALHILGLVQVTLGKKNEAMKQYELLKKLNGDLANELYDYISKMAVYNKKQPLPE